MNNILNMTPKIVLITGGNGGIGYETVKALFESEKPYHIFMGSRSLAKADEAIEKLKNECPSATNRVESLQVDLTSDESIESAFQKVKSGPGHIDALINNAGATFDLEYLADRVSLRECFNNAYNVNVAGTNVMTATFIPLLLKSADPRLIFVTGLSAINQAAESYFPTPPQPAGWPKNIDFETIGYRCSKVALNMMMLDWSHKLKADGVKVCCVGPGMLATNLGGVPELAIAMGAKHPSIGGQLLRKVVEGERDDSMGKIIVQQGVMEW
ncbi:hypothetical protein N7466_006576 [Penicillium verhagenii]|uniref:uncharacterized protein n=1 Tax=Penicillium verhagenii TaxID=1562060 RepID=UPI00254512C4|nr:uncharacterized protein N7466_006576 [Penicillium verhagenii]KAJ5931083.1 hypothetical protein N7466_006576 [Penicillium verhagenii]